MSTKGDNEEPETSNSDPPLSSDDTKVRLAIDSLSLILDSLPPCVPSSENPASSLLHDPDLSHKISSHLRQPNSGAGDNNLCRWLYDTFQSSDPRLQLVVLRFLPIIAGIYLSRAILRKPLAGFEAILLALYAHETTSRNGQPITVNVPDLSHPSVYHESKAPIKNIATELNFAILSPSLEPHGTVRSTKRARIVGVALELYYTKISQIPVSSKIDFCEFCVVWAGQRGDMFIEENNIASSSQCNGDTSEELGNENVPPIANAAAADGEGSPSTSNAANLAAEEGEGNVNTGDAANVAAVHGEGNVFSSNETKVAAEQGEGNVSTSDASSSTVNVGAEHSELNVSTGDATNLSGEESVSTSENGVVCSDNCKEEKEGRIPLPWELLQPTLRILGHCLMGPNTSKELKDMALAASRSLYARALHDVNPQAILATRSLLTLGKLAVQPSQEPDPTEICDFSNNVIMF